MRIGSSVFLKNRNAVQSYDWGLYRSLGCLGRVFSALDEYECDEIALIRVVRDHDTFDDFLDDLKILKLSETATPLGFGGGIRSLRHVEALQSFPVERLIFSSVALSLDQKLLEKTAKLFGRQAIQVILPMCEREGQKLIFIPNENRFRNADSVDHYALEQLSNEIIIYDISNESKEDAFNFNLLDNFDFPVERLVISGGIGKNSVKKAAQIGVASCLIDNRTLHRECHVKELKKYAKLY